MIIALLEVRDIRLTKTARARIRACRDLEVLERWATLARAVESTAELFRAA